MQEDVPGRGWTLGPTSDAYFNPGAGSRELLDRQERYEHLQQTYDNCVRNLSALKDSVHLLEHTFAHYPTACWEEHQRLLVEAQKQKSDIETQCRQREQELHYCKTQIAVRKGELQQLLKHLQDVGKVLTRLEAYAPQLWWTQKSSPKRRLWKDTFPPFKRFSPNGKRSVKNTRLFHFYRFYRRSSRLTPRSLAISCDRGAKYTEAGGR